ncbi:pyridoxal-phosphate dependent enzyme [Rhizobium leguminosarum]|uniref:Pyridoxal-phosphate dependent enzyme n=1 Tax=Rhizobium leguminosarum TaxID=384 RepID=A0A6P0BAX0_RHILE|nr:pyridoxal-phosphate dependent enzyme [Rhizobium leguminosarum]NEI37080.1 pyridoxal-phosphate dependent enzyme [Rhizobium leguminosarum]NEI43556.1 pyridoxal-phosphate dependent enzyme [Rhizobium leguminosarum]
MDRFSLMAQILSDNLEENIEFILSQSVPSRFCDLAAAGKNSGKIRLVDETRQHAGSFKYRGAVLGVSKNPQGVIACGSGNFPIAVGLAASNLGIPATLVMPEDAPVPKREMALNSGSEVLLVPRPDFVDRAEQEAKKRGLPLLHPFRDASMLIGSCSLGAELARTIKMKGSADDAVVVACGGGGLAAGTALGIRISGMDNDIYVAEPKNYPRLEAAISVSRPVEITPKEQTICDALRVTEVGSLAFQVIKKIGVHTLLSSDTSVLDAQARMHRETGVKAEPSGALALAAISENELPRQYSRLWVIVCGGNV